jgi:REP element-mobilizing transposase RayT
MFAAPRKEIRLPRDQYVGRKIYFVTICCEERCPIFQDASRAKIAIDALTRVSESMRFLVHAYCLMPDHVHLLVEGRVGGSNVVKFVAQWKQLTGYLFRMTSRPGSGNGVSTTMFSDMPRIPRVLPGISG